MQRDDRSTNGHETMVAILEDDPSRKSSSNANGSAASSATSTRAASESPARHAILLHRRRPRARRLPLRRRRHRHDGRVRQAGWRRRPTRRRSGGRRTAIATGQAEDRGALLREGQEIIVQVVKEPLGTKGAQLTSHVTMPGRFLVFMPTVDHIGVSRKIESRDERSRLRAIVRGVPRGARLHRRRDHPHRGEQRRRRTSSATSRHSTRSGPRFASAWTRRARRPCSSASRASSAGLRDLLTEDSRRSASTTQEHQRVLELVDRIMPNLAPKVKLYSKPFPISTIRRPGGDRQGAEEQGVAEVGGSIVINQTEALVAIDVTPAATSARSRRTARGHDPQDQPRGSEGIVRDPAARSRRHHRARSHRHGGEEEPPEGPPGGGAGAEEGSIAVKALQSPTSA